MALSARRAIFQARRKAFLSFPLIHRESVSKPETFVTDTHTHSININTIYKLFKHVYIHTYIHISQKNFCDHKRLIEIQTHSETRKLEIVSSLAHLPRSKFRALLLLLCLMASLTPKTV